MKLFVNTKELTDKTKNGKNIPSLKMVEVVLVQCNLVDNQSQHNSEVLYTLTPNRSYAYRLNFEGSNLAFLKTYNNEPDDIKITFTNENGRPLEIEENVNLTLLINKKKRHLIL